MAHTLRELLDAIGAGDEREALAILDGNKVLAHEASAEGASRATASAHFYPAISHYLYAGDTALHMASASHSEALVAALITAGANVNARNRRGATPLHYACDGGPGIHGWDPTAQAAVVLALCQADANVDAIDGSGVAPLHRAPSATGAPTPSRCSSARPPMPRSRTGAALPLSGSPKSLPAAA